MFLKKKRQSHGSMLREDYVPSTLPKKGEDLDSFITADYALLSNAYLESCYSKLEQQIAPLVATTDRYTVGYLFDTFVDAQLLTVSNDFQAEVAMHELQIERIRAARQVRAQELDRLIAESQARMEELRTAIAPLKGKHAQFVAHLGNWHIPLGIPVTILAMIVDAFLNFSFLEGILLQNQFLLILTVIVLSVMSDGSMFVLGTLLSRKDEREFMGSKAIYYTAIAGLLAMFLLSVAAGSVMVRFGSMDLAYGSINSAGEFVGKAEGYSLAEWGVTLVTSFATTATGLISMVFSLDQNAHLESRRRSLETQLTAESARYNSLQSERSALRLAADPSTRDHACRKAAENNLTALRTGLKQHIRKLLALHQQEASYTDSMADSAVTLSNAEATAEATSLHRYDTDLKPDFKEAV
jgi:hypothetical protein